MKITYIYHSGFVVETEGCILVFDFWEGSGWGDAGGAGIGQAALCILQPFP